MECRLYSETHNIFLLPLRINRRKRKLIEGNIAKIIKEHNHQVCNLPPRDIRYIYNRKETKESFIVKIECNGNIFELTEMLRM